VNCPHCKQEITLEDGAFIGDEAVPKSYIRKIYQDIIDSPDFGPEEKIRAGEALAKLEGYVGPAALNKREKMRQGVQIAQYSKVQIEKPKVPTSLAKKKA
jgi:hypothetical protein